MIRALFFIQCDVCGDLFEQVRTGSNPNPNGDRNDWALPAGDLQCTATEEGWFFNSRLRRHWCADCLLELPSPH
jgi:hypothetical protein